MIRSLIPATGLVMAAACLFPSLALARGQNALATLQGPPVIVTQGEATLKRAPERAWVGIATETRDVKAAEARRKSAEAMTAVQAALKATGLGVDAIRTTSYSLTPDMEWNAGRSTLRGYVVRNQIEVRVDILDKLPDVLDAANSTKNTALSIVGPRFDLKNQDAAEQDALKAAVELAVARAQAIAAGARRTLGAIVRVEEVGMERFAPAPMAMRSTMAAGAADMKVDTPITPGEIEVHARVTLTVEIR